MHGQVVYFTQMLFFLVYEQINDVRNVAKQEIYDTPPPWTHHFFCHMKSGDYLQRYGVCSSSAHLFPKEFTLISRVRRGRFAAHLLNHHHHFSLEDWIYSIQEQTPRIQPRPFNESLQGQMKNFLAKV